VAEANRVRLGGAAAKVLDEEGFQKRSSYDCLEVSDAVAWDFDFD
jgi:hypothetical protein